MSGRWGITACAVDYAPGGQRVEGIAAIHPIRVFVLPILPAHPAQVATLDPRL